MGGPGSGNHYHWWRRSKKTVVEHCGSIDARRWGSKGILKAGVRQAGSWPVLSLSRGIIDIDYEVLTLDPAQPVVRLSYAITGAKGEREELKYDVRLTTTRPRFGGLRWWFICPLLSDGRPCGRRVGKLYLPPRGRYFGCRQCHSLTYKSCQEHDKRVDFLRKNPAAIEALGANLEGASVTQLSLILKAALF